MLLVEKKSKITDAGQLWQLDKITQPLICLPPTETICKNFQAGLAKIGVDWFPGIEASSLELIEAYVAGGLGIGLSVSLPGSKLPSISAPCRCPVSTPSPSARYGAAK